MQGLHRDLVTISDFAAVIARLWHPMLAASGKKTAFVASDISLSSQNYLQNLHQHHAEHQ